MSSESTDLIFRCALGELMADFIREKRACGYRYGAECRIFRALDAYLCEIKHSSTNLPKHVVDGWTARRSHERPRTHEHRLRLVHQFGRFLLQRGCAVHLPETRWAWRNRKPFIPHIFSSEQIAALLTAADRLPICSLSPLRHLVVPELFRLLCCCGLRHGEVRHLRVGDVELEQGVLTILDGKFQKDRLVPLPETMQARLRRYADRVGPRPAQAAFFPGPYGEPYSNRGMYKVFRHLLRESGIAHGGRGCGPRVHDLRHTFAVHRLERWYREGADLGAKLPLLATYLGHRSIEGTQVYLRLTPHLFPDIETRLEERVGHVIPRRAHDEDN